MPTAKPLPLYHRVKREFEINEVGVTDLDTKVVLPLLEDHLKEWEDWTMLQLGPQFTITMRTRLLCRAVEWYWSEDIPIKGRTMKARWDRFYKRAYAAKPSTAKDIDSREDFEDWIESGRRRQIIIRLDFPEKRDAGRWKVQFMNKWRSGGYEQAEI